MNIKTLLLCSFLICTSVACTGQESPKLKSSLSLGEVTLSIIVHENQHSEIEGTNTDIFNTIEEFVLTSPVETLSYKNVGDYNFWSSAVPATANAPNNTLPVESVFLNLTQKKPFSFAQSKQVSDELFSFFVKNGYTVEHERVLHDEFEFYDKLQTGEIRSKNRYFALRVGGWILCNQDYCAAYIHRLDANKKAPVCIDGIKGERCFGFPSRDHLNIGLRHRSE